MPYYEQPDNLKKVRIISPMVIIISIAQFLIIFFYRYITGIDNTAGYVAGYFYPIIYVTSGALIATSLNGIMKKTIGLIDLVIVAIVLIVSYMII